MGRCSDTAQKATFTVAGSGGRKLTKEQGSSKHARKLRWQRFMGTGFVNAAWQLTWPSRPLTLELVANNHLLQRKMIFCAPVIFSSTCSTPFTYLPVHPRIKHGLVSGQKEGWQRRQDAAQLVDRSCQAGAGRQERTAFLATDKGGADLE